MKINKAKVISYQHKLAKDYWLHLNFEDKRMLDALANLLHFEVPVTAVIYLQDKFYISFNHTVIEKVKPKIIRQIFELFKNAQYDELYASYIIFNSSYANDLEKMAKQIGSKFSIILKFRNMLIDFHEKCLEFRDKFFQNKNKIGSIVDININYFNILKQYNEHQHEIIKDFKYSELLRSLIYRPLQDVSKILYYIKDYNLEFEILPNPNKMHAEVNIGDFLILKSIKDEKYIGVSRLCCGGCDNVFKTHNQEEGISLKILYRGTSGIYFPLEGGSSYGASLINSNYSDNVKKKIKSLDKKGKEQQKLLEQHNAKITQLESNKKQLKKKNESQKDEKLLKLNEEKIEEQSKQIQKLKEQQIKKVDDLTSLKLSFRRLSNDEIEKEIKIAELGNKSRYELFSAISTSSLYLFSSTFVARASLLEINPQILGSQYSSVICVFNNITPSCIHKPFPWQPFFYLPLNSLNAHVKGGAISELQQNPVRSGY